MVSGEEEAAQMTMLIASFTSPGPVLWWPIVVGGTGCWKTRVYCGIKTFPGAEIKQDDGVIKDGNILLSWETGFCRRRRCL